MPVYVVVDITIHDPETYDEYRTLAPPSIAKYGGRYLVRGGSTKALLVDGPAFDPSQLAS